MIKKLSDGFLKLMNRREIALDIKEGADGNGKTWYALFRHYSKSEGEF